MRRTLTLVFVLIIAATLVAPAFAAEDSDETVTDIGNDHRLDKSDAIDTFASRGHAQTDLTRIDMTVTVAESKDDVGLEGQLFPTDARNDFLRLEYREDAKRTVRIMIPSEYWTPYLREEVASVDGEHTAEFRPVRGGAYTAVIIQFDGPADVVLPAQWDAAVAYQAVEYADERINKSLGFTVRDDEVGWEYPTDENLTSGPGYAIGEVSGDVTVQYDATPDSYEETWINAPKGETFSDDIYYYERGAENGTVYIVSKTDDPPTVRYKVDSTFADRIRGDLNDLKNVPSELKERVGW